MRRSILPLLLVAATQAAYAGAPQTSPVQAGAAQTAMTYTPAQLPVADGVPIAELSVMRWQGGGFEPIPFQIDERDEFGMVWFRDSGFNRSGAAEVFDHEDQLLFMYEDGALKRPDSAVPEEGSLLAELEVRSPYDDTLYFYLVRNNSRRSQVRYIEHDPNTGVTRTPYYFLTADPENELNWQYLGYNGYTGPADASIIDTLKMRMSGGILLKYPRVTLDNDNLRPRRTGFRIGPIRSVMHLETSVVFAGLPVMKLHLQAMRFPAHYEAHSYARIPTLYRRTVKYPQVVVTIDGNNLVGGKTWTSAGGDLRGTVDGKMDVQEKALVEKPLSTDDSWIIFDSGKGFALLTELLIPKELEGIPLELVYQDDATLRNTPESYPGQLPNIGYALNGWPEADELNFAVRLLFFSRIDDRELENIAALRSGRSLITLVHNTDSD